MESTKLVFDALNNPLFQVYLVKSDAGFNAVLFFSLDSVKTCKVNDQYINLEYTYNEQVFR